jgi:phosphoribosyl-ATP pyrophosphohydrolase
MAVDPFTLNDLARRIAERAKASPDESWTARLLAGGVEKAAKKLGEEAVETIIAAISADKQALVRESADLLYHLLVTLHAQGVKIEDVLAELRQRAEQSGLAEKAGRKSPS